jgi:two-component system OmpR family response regulator
MRILLIAPASARQQRLVTRFVDAGHECAWAPDAAAGLELGRQAAFEIVLCDQDLPPEAPLALAPLAVPDPRRQVVLVTGVRLGDDGDTVAAAVIAARFRGLAEVLEGDDLRPRTIRYLDLELDPMAFRGTRNGIDLRLTQTEYRVLECLVRHAESVVSRRMLCHHVWSSEWHGVTNVVDVYVSRVRRKADRNFDVPLVHTVRGVGYRLGARQS